MFLLLKRADNLMTDESYSKALATLPIFACIRVEVGCKFQAATVPINCATDGIHSISITFTANLPN